MAELSGLGSAEGKKLPRTAKAVFKLQFDILARNRAVC